VFAFEWLGLIVLNAGLGAAVLFGHGPFGHSLFGHSRGQVTRSTTIALLAALAGWTTIAVSAR
jgi:hypothetical protein